MFDFFLHPVRLSTFAHNRVKLPIFRINNTIVVASAKMT